MYEDLLLKNKFTSRRQEEREERGEGESEAEEREGYREKGKQIKTSLYL